MDRVYSLLVNNLTTESSALKQALVKEWSIWFP